RRVVGVRARLVGLVGGGRGRRGCRCGSRGCGGVRCRGRAGLVVSVVVVRALLVVVVSIALACPDRRRSACLIVCVVVVGTLLVVLVCIARARRRVGCRRHRGPCRTRRRARRTFVFVVVGVPVGVAGTRDDRRHGPL